MQIIAALLAFVLCSTARAGELAGYQLLFTLVHTGDSQRPVWVIRPDGTDAHVIEPLHYQCSMDGSRAAWKPLAEGH